MATSSTGRGKRGAIGWTAVTTLAGYGLSEAEIRVKLKLPAEFSTSQREAFDAAFREGRLLGSAEMKEAQHKAAINGQISAQSRVLHLLEDESDETEIRVVQKIFGTDDEES